MAAVYFPRRVARREPKTSVVTVVYENRPKSTATRLHCLILGCILISPGNTARPAGDGGKRRKQMANYTVDGFEVVTGGDDAHPDVRDGVEVFALRGKLVAAPEVEVTILWTVTDASADDWSNACDWEAPYLSPADCRLAHSVVGVRS